MPGMDTAAPDLTERSKGSAGSPSFFPMHFSTNFRPSSISSQHPAGSSPPFSWNAAHVSVVTVKPAGTERPMRFISARLAPLPPRRVFMEASPSACPSPKVKTRFVTAGASGAAMARDTTRTLLARALETRGA